MARGPCIFCHRDAVLTGEHLWSKWIEGLFETDEYTVRRTHPTGEVKEWQLVGLDHTARLVCEKCNSGWMSDLETQSKSLLSSVIKYGDPLSFLPSGVATLAAYAFKGAIISDHTYRDRKPFFSVHIRDRFRLRLEIPPGAQMWIAACGTVGSQLSGIFRSYVFQVGVPSGPLRNAEFFCFTWSAGHVALQVLAAKWRKYKRRYQELPILTPDTRWNPVSVRFWPSYGRPVTWNPAGHLGDKSLEVFRDRWTAPVISNIGQSWEVSKMCVD